MDKVRGKTNSITSLLAKLTMLGDNARPYSHSHIILPYCLLPFKKNEKVFWCRRCAKNENQSAK